MTAAGSSWKDRPQRDDSGDAARRGGRAGFHKNKEPEGGRGDSAPPRQARGRRRRAPRPLTKMRLKRLFSLGGSCTLGMAAGWAGWVPPAHRLAGRAPGQGAAENRAASPGSAHWPRAGAGRVGQGCWPGLTEQRGRRCGRDAAAASPGLGPAARVPRTARWRPRPAPPRAWRRAHAPAASARGACGRRLLRHLSRGQAVGVPRWRSSRAAGLCCALPVRLWALCLCVCVFVFFCPVRNLNSPRLSILV